MSTLTSVVRGVELSPSDKPHGIRSGQQRDNGQTVTRFGSPRFGRNVSAVRPHDHGEGCLACHPVLPALLGEKSQGC
jgi:hypothetical protein